MMSIVIPCSSKIVTAGLVLIPYWDPTMLTHCAMLDMTNKGKKVGSVCFFVIFGFLF
eukprot:m.257121 g.257121  ORF g.257121 m.257121 type:complete len:57 (+) comp35000_c0_seq1:1288-1458(+)